MRQRVYLVLELLASILVRTHSQSGACWFHQWNHSPLDGNGNHPKLLTRVIGIVGTHSRYSIYQQPWTNTMIILELLCSQHNSLHFNKHNSTTTFILPQSPQHRVMPLRQHRRLIPSINNKAHCECVRYSYLRNLNHTSNVV